MEDLYTKPYSKTETISTTLSASKTYDTYLNLIYGPKSESDNEEIEDSDSLTSEGDEILSGAPIDKKNARKENSEKDIGDFNNIEYLPAADTTGLLKKVW
ncbi:10019_t:CDS:2, partial [Dentiscutata heterogama]